MESTEKVVEELTRFWLICASLRPVSLTHAEDNQDRLASWPVKRKQTNKQTNQQTKPK